MKKLLAFLLIISLICTLSVNASAETLLIAPAPSARPAYTDASTIPDYGFAPVLWASQKSILLGDSQGTLRPNDPCTRAEFAALLYRLCQASDIDVSIGENTNILSYSDAFDIPEYAFPALQWACGSGLLTHDGSGALRPNAPCTRAELVSVLYAFALQQGYDVSVGEDTNILSYTDAFDIPEYAFSALQWACGAGILKGDDTGALMPNDPCTRVQALALLYRGFGL